MAKPRVVGYVRVSTDGQTDGVSLDAQRAAIEAYCKIHGVDLCEIIADEGISAKATANRPGAMRLLRMVRQKQIDGLVVYKLDRLVRSVRHAIEIAELCQQRCVALHSIQERIDTSSAIGKFFFTLLAALAELERCQIGERTRDALRHKRRQGEKTGGTVPFGFRSVVRRQANQRVRCLEPVPDEQRVLRWIRRRASAGDSLRKIAASLNRRGVSTKTGRGQWHPEVVRGILRQTA